LGKSWIGVSLNCFKGGTKKAEKEIPKNGVLNQILPTKKQGA